MSGVEGRTEMCRKAKLLFFCGKMAAGKSTLSRELAERENAVLLVQDEFLERLFPGEIVDIPGFYEARGFPRALHGQRTPSSTPLRRILSHLRSKNTSTSFGMSAPKRKSVSDHRFVPLGPLKTI